jgi:predicted Zn-dependent peptidase
MKISKTESGMPYILYPLKTGYTALASITAFGALDENKKHSAHTLEHMLFEGTKTKNYRDIDETLSYNAIEYNAATYTDTIKIYTLGVTRKTDILIDLISDTVQNSIFPSERLEKEKGPIKNEPKADKNGPVVNYYTIVYEALYGNNGEGKKIVRWARPPTGPEIDALTVEDLKREYERAFVPENMVFIAYGGMNLDKISKTIDDKFSSFYRKGPKRDFSEIKPLGKKKEIGVENPKSPYSRLEMFIPTTGFKIDNRKEYLSLSMISTILNNNLYKTLRQENGLIYSINVENNGHIRFGTLNVYTESSSNDFLKVRRIIDKEIDRIHAGEIDPDYIKKIKSASRDAYIVEKYRNPISSAIRIALLELQARVISGYENYSLLSQKPIDITTDDIRAACDKYINLDRAVNLSFINKKT